METTLFLFVFEVKAGNSNKNFDAEFSKPLVQIDLFIMNMRMLFVQKKSFIEKRL